LRTMEGGGVESHRSRRKKKRSQQPQLRREGEGGGREVEQCLSLGRHPSFNNGGKRKDCTHLLLRGEKKKKGFSSSPFFFPEKEGGLDICPRRVQAFYTILIEKGRGGENATRSPFCAKEGDVNGTQGRIGERGGGASSFFNQKGGEGGGNTIFYLSTKRKDRGLQKGKGGRRSFTFERGEEKQSLLFLPSLRKVEIRWKKGRAPRGERGGSSIPWGLGFLNVKGKGEKGRNSLNSREKGGKSSINLQGGKSFPLKKRKRSTILHGRKGRGKKESSFFLERRRGKMTKRGEEGVFFLHYSKKKRRTTYLPRKRKRVRRIYRGRGGAFFSKGGGEGSS